MSAVRNEIEESRGNTVVTEFTVWQLNGYDREFKNDS